VTALNEKVIKIARELLLSCWCRRKCIAVLPGHNNCRPTRWHDPSY